MAARALRSTLHTLTLHGLPQLEATRPLARLDWLATIATLAVAVGACAAEPEHPFILWTPREAAALREKIRTQPWAKASYEELFKDPRGGSEGLPQLLKYSVMGDRAAGEAEKKVLLAEPRGRGLGNYISALRYDILYDLLTPDERQGVEKALREAIRGTVENMKSRRWTRWNWLPNLAYPSPLGIHLMAAALRDKELCREVFASPYMLKWYFDEYLSDLGFYNEEFGKMFATPGDMLLWCKACDRLGLSELGFDYVGRQGATMRGHIESQLRITMPRVDLGTARPHYAKLTMGDAKGSRGMAGYGFQHSLVPGFLLGDPDDPKSWFKGLLPQPIWLELAHAKYPDAGFGYFLLQLRGPGEDKYYPTLFFGLDPIDPALVRPPPAPSGVYPGRGLVVLRADESPAYWESEAPAVGMRLATPYAHHVQDSFCLLGFYAFNRPLYVNHQHSTNYSGVDPGYSNSSRSHTIVRVDFCEPRTIGEVPTRHGFSELVKFAAARGKGIFEGVDQTRALMLTREYLLDVSRLVSDRPRFYQWIVQTFGHACPDQPSAWAPTRDLVGSIHDFGCEQSCATAETWTVTAVQSSLGAHHEFSGFGERWFAQRNGVRVTMLGEPGTTAYTAWSPVVSDAPGTWRGKDRFAFGEDEPAGAAIVANRRAQATTFVAVHEPFKTVGRMAAVRRVEQSDRGVVVRVTALAKDASPAFTDYLMLRFGDQAEQPITMGAGGARFTFADYAYVRVTAEAVKASGGLHAMRLAQPAGKTLELRLNDKTAATRVEGGELVFGDLAAAPASAQAFAPEAALAGPIAARWMPPTALCLPAGGQRTMTLRLRNNGLRPVNGAIELKGSPGLTIAPPNIELKDFAPGAEMDLSLAVSAAKDTANRILRVWPASAIAGVDVQRNVLKVAHGVVSERDLFWPADFNETIYAPRYIARYYYMEAGTASLLLDPQGFRRSDYAATTYPNLVRWGDDGRGGQGWVSEKGRRFAYFVTVVVPGEGDKPAHLYEAGRHAHGTVGPLEHWFYEDWIVIRNKEGKPGEKLAYDWLAGGRGGLERTIVGRREDLAAEKKPGKVLLATPDGKLHDAGNPNEWPGKAAALKDVSEVAGLFYRPHGYDCGAAMFYPSGSRRDRQYIAQSADQPMAFAFCLEEEFPTLLAKWLKEPHTGVATPEEAGRYGGAFMPHLEKSE